MFVSQIAAKLTSRDLGAFFEDMLGEGSVRDARIVTDRVSRKSKGSVQDRAVSRVDACTADLLHPLSLLTPELDTSSCPTLLLLRRRSS